MPYISCGKIGVTQPMKRSFGLLDFEVTSLGLGGQASLEYTGPGIDPTQIIYKAFKLGINYFDTSNGYGPSQMNFGKAFKGMNLIPGKSGYDEKLRLSTFLTTKTHVRWAKMEGPVPEELNGVYNWTDGKPGSTTVDDLKRSVSQMFGDGKGNYPKGAYLDMVLIHNLNTMNEVDAVFEGYDNPDPAMDRIGAIAALRDYRDGTNLTGLNPTEEKLIRHIGFSGHHSPPVMMEMIQRDSQKLFDAMLISMNAHDRNYFNMQYNAIPLAQARNMGVIGMKLFSDGAMYTKEPRWSRGPEDVVMSVGSPELSSRSLIEYALTVPGIQTAIIGIGHIDNEKRQCQLEQNLSAAQILPNALLESDRREIEKMAKVSREGKSNYFQIEAKPLSPPQNPLLEQKKQDNQRLVKITWHTAFAGNEPLEKYEIWRDDTKITEVPHHPQISKVPFVFEDQVPDKDPHVYKVISMDVSGNSANTESLKITGMT
jgi:predicted aldo/keto reductase-like oxidoreductase